MPPFSGQETCILSLLGHHISEVFLGFYHVKPLSLIKNLDGVYKNTWVKVDGAVYHTGIIYSLTAKGLFQSGYQKNNLFEVAKLELNKIAS